MNLPLPLVALLLGVVEGLTEFLPVSSTGHLILAGSLCGLEGERAEVFEVFIQLGAVLAVIVEYRAKLASVILGLPRDPGARSFAASLVAGFVPFAIIGLSVHDWIAEHLFGPRTVAGALIAGAVAILVVERARPSIRVARAEDVGLGRAALIGLAQCAALWPGFSRAAATILGGLLCGLERRAATEFSFFLAVPTLGAATVYDLIKKHDALAPGDATWLLVATAVSFVVAWGSIRWLLRFVASHDLTPFAWYRIALGVIVLAALR